MVTLPSKDPRSTTGKIRPNIKFAAFWCVFLTNIKVDPESWRKKLSIKHLRKKENSKGQLNKIKIMNITFIWTEIWKNQEARLTFLRGHDARHGSSECRPALN